MTSLGFVQPIIKSSNKNAQYAIHVLFLEPDGRDPWLNRLTSFIGKKMHERGFCHVEICVPNFPGGFGGGQNGYLSSSIYNGESVTATGVKTFANPGYTVHTELVSWDQLQRIIDRIGDARRMELRFDAIGMCLAALPFNLGISGSGRRTFCSRYITELLQSSGVGGESIKNLDAHITTPSKLYKILSSGQDGRVGVVVGTVPFKQASMASRGYEILPSAPAGLSMPVAKKSIFSVGQ